MSAKSLWIIVVAALALPSSAAGVAMTFQKIADTSTPIPGGSGTFTRFDAPAALNVHGYFLAYGSNGQAGIYAAHESAQLSLVADRNTPVPGGSGNFEQFGHPTPGGAFTASGGGRVGVYRRAVSTPGVPIAGVVRVADDTTAAPGGGTFTQFGLPSSDWISSPVTFRAVTTTGIGAYHAPRNGPITTVAKVGDSAPGITIAELSDPEISPGYGVTGLATGTDGVRWLYTSSGAGALNFLGNVPPIDVMDQMSFGRTGGFGYIGENDGVKGVYYFDRYPEHNFPWAKVGDPIPGGVGGFTDFDSLSVTDRNLGIPSAILSFRGHGPAGQVGIYWSDGRFHVDELIARGDMLDGKVIDDLGLAPDNMEDILLSFRATFTDGSSAIYLATVPEPSASWLAAVALMRFACRRRSRSARSFS
jgi:hypothetical protein